MTRCHAHRARGLAVRVNSQPKPVTRACGDPMPRLEHLSSKTCYGGAPLDIPLGKGPLGRHPSRCQRGLGSAVTQCRRFNGGVPASCEPVTLAAFAARNRWQSRGGWW
jgi:hypothetical protein